MQRSLVVVGAGPAGMAAAIEAVARGCKVTVIDEAARPGGQIYRQAHAALDGPEFAEPAELKRKKHLLQRFDSILDRIDYRPQTVAYAAYGNGEIHVSAGQRTEALHPDAVVVATGVREQAIPFPGWTTPGVMFAGGAQAILKSQRVLPGKKAVIAGCGPLPMVVAAQLIRAGGAVAALAMLSSPAAMLKHPRALWDGRTITLEGFRYAWSVLKAGVPQLTGHVPVRAIGTDKLEAVRLARVDANGRVVAGTEREIACDLLAVNYGFVANSELTAMAGARMRRDPVAGLWLPETDADGRTSLPWLFAAGDTAGLRGALIAESEGTIVGAAAAAGTGAVATTQAVTEAVARRQQYDTFRLAVRDALQLPAGLWAATTDDTIVCRCEGVALSEIRRVMDDGHRTLNAIKRNVRAGMGWCGGRMCQHAVSALAALHCGAAPESMMTPRPMARPVTFAALSAQTKAAAQ
jgi:D-hydroxyproline dehydrogenase subunit alpha